MATTIELRYRFLRCADEIKVAYALDRQSLKTSEAYQLMRGQDRVMVNPGSNPPAPTSIDTTAWVKTKS